MSKYFGNIIFVNWHVAIVFVFALEVCLLNTGSSAPVLKAGNVTATSSDHRPTANQSLNPDDLKRPDHLQGVKLERDGDLNSNFRQEVMVGNEIKTLKSQSPESLLTDIFHKADTDNSKDLDLRELSEWISSKVKEHMDKAIRENFYLFTAIDRDRNGLVTWSEYHYNFMLDRGFGDEFAKNHSESHKGMERKVREEILLDRAAFSETAKTNPDGLNIDEFLSFRHPEHSHVTLLTMVQEIFENLDDNSDNILTVDEFANFSPAEHEMPEQLKKADENWKAERRREFQEVIDINHDGKVDRQELLLYSDPMNPAHSKTEAKNLISLADINGSGTLSLSEILAKKELFIGSKMVNTAKSFHDEF